MSAGAGGGDVNMMELELMHNFTTFTYLTIGNDPAVGQLLRVTAVYRAFDCEYLMRSILAVSALHLSRYRPSRRDLYIQRAMEHHQLASSAAIELMSELKFEDCENLHLFSVLTVYYGVYIRVLITLDITLITPPFLIIHPISPATCRKRNVPYFMCWLT